MGSLQGDQDASNVPPEIRSGPSHTSILSGSDKLAARQRCDSHGNTIQKGSKSHRCSWRDEMDEKKAVSDIKEVQAFKTHNLPNVGFDRDDDKQGCHCILM
mmetsp:Transcript_123945/g.246764  ORF Transcript_123945/g.246764 Transcript_123945/m.246764 type:complete len:101 (+) Transcript_123945:108-410(+)